jgi:class 3 adenylate cyclase
MFCDLVDSTPFSEQLDPEDYREVLHTYQQSCSEVIHRFGGYIAQHLGDALLVYFGFPQAHENESQRAVLAGLGMLEVIKTLNTRLEPDKGIRLAIRVGIHTGLTVVGDVGTGPKHELLALGEAPNIAARIQSIAAPDTIAISQTIYRLIEGYFTCQALGAQTLKGVSQPLPVYRVLGASAAHSRFEVVTSRGLTPMVGREDEMAFLRRRWEQSREGQGQVVYSVGKAALANPAWQRCYGSTCLTSIPDGWFCVTRPITAIVPSTR